MHQWYYKLTHAFGGDIGIYYNSEKILKPITVVTYHSASDLLSEHSTKYRLIIFDEFSVIDEC